MISAGSWLFICILLFIIKYCFLLPHEDKRLYCMYEARDNVALAATQGEIDQNSKEYNFVMNQINFEIYYIKNNYDFSILLNNVIRKPEKVKKYYDSVYKLASEYEVLEKSLNVSSVHFFKSLNIRLFAFYLIVIKPFHFILGSILKTFLVFEKLSMIGNNTIRNINKKLSIIKDIDKDYRTYRNDYIKRAM